MANKRTSRALGNLETAYNGTKLSIFVRLRDGAINQARTCHIKISGKYFEDLGS